MSTLGNAEQAQGFLCLSSARLLNLEMVLCPKCSLRKNAREDDKERQPNSVYSAPEKDQGFKSTNNHKSMQTKPELCA